MSTANTSGDISNELNAIDILKWWRTLVEKVIGGSKSMLGSFYCPFIVYSVYISERQSSVGGDHFVKYHRSSSFFFCIFCHSLCLLLLSLNIHKKIIIFTFLIDTNVYNKIFVESPFKCSIFILSFAFMYRFQAFWQQKL